MTDLDKLKEAVKEKLGETKIGEIVDVAKQFTGHDLVR